MYLGAYVSLRGVSCLGGFYVIDSSIVELPSSTFAKVFRVNNSFNSLLLIVLIFVLVLN
jgi:hypothetical protein